MLAILIGLSAFAEESSPVIWTTFPIHLTAVAEPSSGTTSDANNIYTLTVDFADAKYSNNNKYTLMYFEDSRPLQEFKDQTLPFTFKRNYKGLLSGDHEIKIDVEYGKGTVLATQTTTIRVVHKNN